MGIRYLKSDDQLISSYTGFNMLTRRNQQLQKDTVGYLPTTDSAATQMNTSFEISNKPNSIKNTLNLLKNDCCYKSRNLSKTQSKLVGSTEIIRGIISQIGDLYTTSVFVAVISQIFAVARLRNTIIESKVIAEGSIEKTLNGKYYNRAVHLHKPMFEACMTLI